ncbi:MAG: helix-turn-helix transcriptional regulator [Candidatus Aminicenantes bacterium]|nr:helix-turn-helix transcriptional regulator [Candidatus Aminicenantes bacterium]
MRFSGLVFKVGKHWAIEVPILGMVTQGKTKKDAHKMIADAVETLANKDGFKVEVFPGKGDYFEIGSSDVATLIAFLLKRQRLKQGLTLAEVAKRMGAKSHNAFARYEQGRSVPTMDKFVQLLAALSPDTDFVLMESHQH